MSIQSAFRNRSNSSSRRLLTTTSRTHQTFHLSDGRTLGFAEFGKEDGKPVFYFHGYPSSRLEAQPIHDIAHRCGVRLIALDRPGFGLSTFKPGYQILDWPTDVMEFANANHIPKFSVLGLSGGGPFALACAYALPKRAITSVGLFASAPHWAAGTKHVEYYRRVFKVWSDYSPSTLRAALYMLYLTLRWVALSGPVSRRLNKWLEAEHKKEQAKPETSKPEYMSLEELVELALDEPFRQGAAAVVHEMDLLTSKNWGFKLEEVKYENIQIWHGKKDGNAPIQMIRWMADRIQGSELHEFEDDTHYTMYKHFEPALRRLVENEAA
ncbi:hydrolase or acyltransferase (alpha beta hydrolase superfamily) [Fusarium beomiforme]|uniref:Hydrolase or acyltransferase (Alpha beta hydrolase superfamily) n=1 Tax=Fusarium beomiforme TaxID=44412 RepID=A0A9P5AS38_9HYPO|nr:hydrolase or acyltransferase (alpha beta hydrolase superfamily) [Fusarium beomiforme]